MGDTGEGEDAQRVPVPQLPDEALPVRQEVFNDIFNDCSSDTARYASRAEREANGQEDNLALTYSELDLNTVHRILNIAKGECGAELFANEGSFLDLGSGTGRACVAAGLCHPFQKVIGIESVQCLHEFALANNEKYKEKEFPDGLLSEGVTKTELQFIKGDFVNELQTVVEPEASSVIVCLACATCYGEEHLNAMATVAQKMPDNSVFVTFTQELPDAVLGGDKMLPAERYSLYVKKALGKPGCDPDEALKTISAAEVDTKPGGWRQVYKQDFQMVWGELATCFFFKKIPLPVNPEATAEEQAQEG